MHRFFVSFSLDDIVDIIDPRLLHQLMRVLRSQEWDDIVLFDGDGSEHIYSIMEILKKSIRLKRVSQRFPQRNIQKSIALYQAIPNKYEKIEYILQKGIEVGIWEFVFFRSDRSQKLLITKAKMQRFSLIAQEALEQCGGTVMPTIHFVSGDQIEETPIKYDTIIALHTIGTTSTLHIYKDAKNIALFVWPEWGWSETEVQKIHKNWWITARFWDRILRTETAGIAVAFGLLHI